MSRKIIPLHSNDRNTTPYVVYVRRLGVTAKNYARSWNHAREMVNIARESRLCDETWAENQDTGEEYRPE